MTIPMPLRIHPIPILHHATVSRSDVIGRFWANEAYTPWKFQPERTRGWLRLCWFAFNKAGAAWKPSVCERLVFHLFGNGYVRETKLPIHWSTLFSLCVLYVP